MRTQLRIFYAGKIVLFATLAVVCAIPALGYLAEFRNYVQQAIDGLK